jgi:hypothetical protein
MRIMPFVVVDLLYSYLCCKPVSISDFLECVLDLLYCTVLAVLVGLQTTPLNLSHSFIADYTRRYYNRSVTNSSLTNCVEHSLFPLAPDYSPSTLGSRCLFSRQLLTDLLQLWLPLLWLWLVAVFHFYWLQLPSHCLKKGLARPKWEHLLLLFTYAL